MPLALATSLTALTNLDLSDNLLEGFWPEFNNSRSLEKLSIGGNRFQGPLPRLRYNKAMKILNASSNHFSGPLDPWYGSLSSMNVLNVSFNLLSGNFSESICRLRELGGILNGPSAPLCHLDHGREPWPPQRVGGHIQGVVQDLHALASLSLEPHPLFGHGTT